MKAPAKRSSILTKEHILDAAQHRFEHYGLAKVTMDEIALDAGIGKASIYYYFPTKESLFKAVIVEKHDALIKRIREIMACDVAASDKITSYVEERFQYFTALMNLNILELQSPSGVKPVFREMFDVFAQEELSYLRRILQEGKRSREFRVDSIAHVAEAFLHVMQGLRMRFLRRRRVPKIETQEYKHLKEELDLVTGIFLQGISR